MSGFSTCANPMCAHIDHNHLDRTGKCEFCDCEKFVQPGAFTRSIAAGTSVEQLTGWGNDGPTLISGKPVGGGF